MLFRSCVLEKRLPLAAECSVIVARGRDGQTVSLPVQRNLHRNGILAVSEIHEGNIPAPLATQAQAATCRLAHELGYVGDAGGQRGLRPRHSWRVR